MKLMKLDRDTPLNTLLATAGFTHEQSTVSLDTMAHDVFHRDGRLLFTGNPGTIFQWLRGLPDPVRSPGTR